jgi:serine/threonine-protein kinase
MIPGTDLHGRYTVGILIGANGEGANYIAYDKKLHRKVLIREFMPAGLCSRVKGKPLVGISYNHLAEYKALMAEFTELNRNLARYRGLTHIITILDMFAENNTTYVVSEYVEGITLTEYLKENTGKLPIDRVREIFSPVLISIAKINKAGIIHRGLCPDTIYITDDGEFRISGFSISAIRTKGAELEPELFDGYTAPEQYSVNGRQGTFTDVYAVSAVVYRMLTGVKPVSAAERLEKDSLAAPSEVNPKIPQNLSVAVMRGLSLTGEHRIQTVEELNAYLFGGMAEYLNESDEVAGDGDFPEEKFDDKFSESEYVPGYQDDYAYDDKFDLDPKPVERASASDRLKVPIIVAVILLVVLLVIVFGITRVLGGNSGTSTEGKERSTTEVTGTTVSTAALETTGGDSEMMDIVGKEFDQINDWAKSNSWFVLEPEYEYSDEYEEGIITWQSVKKGESFATGDKIKVKVSKGSRYIELPAYSGYGYEAYGAKLTELGIEWTTSSREGTGVSDYLVVGTSVPDGEKYDRKSGETVVIYYAYTSPTDPPVVETEPVVDNGGDYSGGDNSGGDYSGGDNSGGDYSGGDNGGGDYSGGDGGEY